MNHSAYCVVAAAVVSGVAGCDPPSPAASTPVVSAAPAASPADPGAGPPAVGRAESIPRTDALADKTFDDLKFDILPDAAFQRSMLSDTIRALDGRRIRIRGYILPTARQHGIRQFVLVRDNQECCFGPGAALYDCILVTMEGGATAEFSVRPVAVEGRFAVEEFFGPEGRPLAIYRLAGESVR